MKIPAVLILLLVTPLSGRTWTDVKGRTINAEIVRVDGDSVIVNRNGAELPIKLETLGAADQQYVAEWRKTSAPAESAPAGAVAVDGTAIQPGGKMHLIEKPYSAELLKDLASGKGSKIGTGDSSPDMEKEVGATERNLHLAVAVPEDFDSAKPANVFIVITAVNSEAERAKGNIAKFPIYGASCVENGWVCIAVDSDKGVPSSFATYEEAFALLEKSWPGFHGSNFAAGGFSGGSKGCWAPVAWLLKRKQNVVGVYMGGCNEDYSESRRREFGASSSGYRKIRAYMSTGKEDKIATPSMAEGVMKSLKSNGVRNVRFELHDGGHSHNKEHFKEALNWFAEPQK